MDKNFLAIMFPKWPLVVVGGSLSGLTFALACAKFGIRTHVLERAHADRCYGGALGIDRSLLARATGFDPRSEEGGFSSLPVVSGLREATSWYAVHRWLRERALQCEEITLTEGFSVSQVTQHRETATALATDGRRISAQIVIGADGYQSLVRAAINSTEKCATYAGYILWRGLVDERHLPRSTKWPRNDQGGGFINARGHRLIAYPVPGLSGSTQHGERQISFAWYDPTRDALFREQHGSSESRTSLAPLDRESISQQLRDELFEEAQEIWPDPWRAFVVQAVTSRDVFATPIAEYYPERLCRGRLAIIGDAAHVVSPITGRGFVSGVLDAETLAKCLKASCDQGKLDGVIALRRYEDERLGAARELAMTSKKWSCEYLSEFHRRQRLLQVRAARAIR